MLSFSFTLCSTGGGRCLAKLVLIICLFMEGICIHVYKILTLQRLLNGKGQESLLNYIFALEKPLYYQL